MLTAQMCSLTYWITVKRKKCAELFAYVQNLLYLCGGFVLNAENTYSRYVLNVKSTKEDRLLNIIITDKHDKQ